MQTSLFSNNPAINGLKYIPSYISKSEEQGLIEIIDKQKWLESISRRTQHYGWQYDYKARKTSPDLYLGKLPLWLDIYAGRLYQEGLVDEKPDQVIINEYIPPQGITPHIDCVPCFGEVIASLSLSSAVIMDFAKDGQKESVLLEPCSLLIMSGDARYKWQHSIAKRKTDRINGSITKRERRISLTFRRVIQ